MKRSQNLKIMALICSFLILVLFISPIVIVHYTFDNILITSFVIFLVLIFLLFEYYQSVKHTVDTIPSKEIDLEESKNIDKMLSEVANDMNIKKPRLHICKVGYPNAFAVGRKGKGHIFLSKTFTDILNNEEIKAVLYHEASHLKRRDMFPLIMVNELSETIGVFIYNITGGMDLREHLAIVFKPLTFPISQYREYIADSSACKYTKSENLENALKKIVKYNQKHSPKVMSNSLVNSLSLDKPDFDKILSTHPSLENRLENIKRFKNK